MAERLNSRREPEVETLPPKESNVVSITSPVLPKMRFTDPTRPEAAMYVEPEQLVAVPTVDGGYALLTKGELNKDKPVS